jgi:hypothetical protein
MVETATASLADLSEKLLRKATEGGVNTFLLWWLSVCTQAYLRPIRK